jgi:hypothetical protein
MIGLAENVASLTKGSSNAKVLANSGAAEDGGGVQKCLYIAG